MQDVGTWGSSLSVGEEIQAVDGRDGKTYTVLKALDGKIWMTQNLDLDLGATYLTSHSTVLSHDDTDLGWGTSNFDANAEWDTEDWGTNTNEVTTWDYYSDLPMSYDPGNVCWLGLGETTASSACANRHYHLGNYSWFDVAKEWR